MNPVVLIAMMITCCAYGQNFNNSDLEGSVNMSATPPGWFSVSFSDNNCQAYNTIAATPDITGVSGPIPGIGISGQPFSGNSFVSGLISGNAGALHHEGIRQIVNGLIPGKPYTIKFYQTVVKQNNQLDTSGAWSVFLDNTLMGISAPSASPLTYNNQNLIWEERTLSFTATQSSHQFKFLPTDDDTDQTVPNESLRMGIDHITLFPDSSHVHHDTICLGELATVWAEGANQYHWVSINDPDNVLSYDATLHISPDSTAHYWCITDLDTSLATVTVLHPPMVNLGPDRYICAGDSITIPAEVQHANIHYWDNGSTAPELHTGQEGMHWFIAENGCGIASDSVSIHVDTINALNFGWDSSICSHESIILEVYHPNSSYTWNDGSYYESINVTTPGNYIVTINNACGSSTHEFNIHVHSCPSTLEMPNVFSPNNDGTNDYFVPIHTNHILTYQCIILNRWGDTVYETADLTKGWDGFIKGQRASEGVYFWKVVYSSPQANNIEEHGSLTLVR